MEYKHGSIVIKDGAWVCTRAIVLPNSVIGSNSVISAGEIFKGNLPEQVVFAKSTHRPYEIREDSK